VTTAYLAAFVIGLASALHCAGMCGGIVGALSFSLPAGTRAHPGRLAAYLLAYNLGRVASYALAGALFGWLGGLLMAAGARSLVDDVLRLTAAVLMVGIGLHLGGWFPRLAWVERLGEPVWRRLEPLARRLVPVRGLPMALLYGAIWGWLPCGLVYGMLIGAPAQGGALGGALYMALFGLGTLPVSIGGGFLAGRLYGLGRDRRLQALAGALVIALGLTTLHFQGYHG
jgi:sulfite exporter TauE/SafE